MAPSIRTRSSMTIYCDNSLLSHAIRYCIAVKGIDVEREMIDVEAPNKAFEAVNPYGN